MAGLADLLESCRFSDVLWRVAARAAEGEPPDERALAAAMAAQHLGLWREARNHALEWAAHGAHVAEGPRVSIVVTTREAPAALRRALRSLAAQIYRPLEAVVVHDAGTPVGDVLEEFAESLELRTVRLDENRPPSAARNAGLALAGGFYVGYLDGDDQLYPHHVGHLVALIQTWRSRAGCAAAHRHRLAGKPPEPRLQRFPQRSFDGFDLLVDNVAPVQAVLHERSLIETAGGFDESLRAGDDWDLWIRLRGLTAIERSPLVTSCVEARTPNRSIEASPAPFLHAHAQVYRRHREQAERLGGAALLARQRERLRELVAETERHVKRERRVRIVVTGAERGDVEEAALELGDGTPVEPLVVEHAGQLRDGLIRVAEAHPDDDVALVDEACVGALTPGWLTRLQAHLAGDVGLAAVTAVDLGRIDESRLAEWLGADVAESGAENARRLRRYRMLMGEPAERIDGGCLLVRAEDLRRGLTALDAERIEDPWSELLRGWRERGREVRAAEDVCLLPPYEEAEGARASAAAPAEEAPAAPRPPLLVLGYHRVVAEPAEDPFVLAVSRQRFDEQLALLAERFRIVRPSELFDDGPDDDPRPRLLITFDDGYRDNYEVAFPLLWQREIPAALFVTTGCIESGRPFWWEALARGDAFRKMEPRRRAALQEEWRHLEPAERQRRLDAIGLDAGALAAAAALSADWRMLAEMADSGWIEIGAHTRSHPSLGRLPRGTVEDEIAGSIEDLTARLGRRPRLFAYPHGSAGDVSETAIEVLREQGIDWAFTTIPAVIDAAPQPGSREALTLPRFMARDTPAEQLVAELEERLVGLAQDDARAPLEGRRSIVVLSGISANNLGDDAMLIATVHDLRRLDPRAEITVLAEDPSRCRSVEAEIETPILHSPQLMIRRYLERLGPDEQPALAVADLARALLERQADIAAGKPIEQIPEEFLAGLRKLVGADGVVDCGGANLSVHWKSYFYEKCVDYLLAARPLLVSGQGIDRFDDENDRQLLLAALSCADEITLREDVSEAYLRELGCRTPFGCTGDDALTLESSGGARLDLLLERAGLAPGQAYVAFQFRHYLDYGEPRFLERFAGYVDAAIRASGLVVVGVPMHFGDTDEREHLRAVRRHVAAADRFHVVESHLTPGDAHGLLGRARAVFGISYHSAIFALGAGTPYLGLYRGAHYTQKMEGLARLWREPRIPVPVDETTADDFGRRLAEQLSCRKHTRERLLERAAELRRVVSASRRRFLERVGPSCSQNDTAPAEIDWGALRRHEPISRAWGFDRGRPVDRFYIERFLERNRERIRGAVCELLDDGYAQRFGAGRLERVEVLDVDPHNPRATLVDDLSAPGKLREEMFDCFILTQTLPYIFECGAALGHAYASLRPGGSLLVTVPSIIKYNREPEDHWRFTADSLERLIRERCPGSDYRVESHGNLVAAIGFLHGLAVEDLRESELTVEDPEFPLVITAVVTRGAAGGSLGNVA